MPQNNAFFPHQQGHFVELDSFRGLAAGMVAVFHSLIVLPCGGQEAIWRTSFSDLTTTVSIIVKVLLIFFSGTLGVSIFFVLSGYVLGLSLDKCSITARQYFDFLVKRIFRIYPAHIISLTICSVMIVYSAEFV